VSKLFSCLTSITSKDRNRLISVEDELRAHLSKVDPELCICAAKNMHRFHIKEQISFFILI
jgi:hypothetical protein